MQIITKLTIYSADNGEAPQTFILTPDDENLPQADTIKHIEVHNQTARIIWGDGEIETYVGLPMYYTNRADTSD